MPSRTPSRDIESGNRMSDMEKVSYSLKSFFYYYNCQKIDAPKLSACETVILQLGKNPLHLENYKFAT